jgi:hypothetical protein
MEGNNSVDLDQRALPAYPLKVRRAARFCENVCSGSKPVKLRTSKCFPVCPSDISHLHSMTNCGVAANRWSRDAGDLKRRPRQLGAGPTFPRTKLPGLMRLNLGLHARRIYRIRRQKRAMLIWIKYFSNLSRNSRKALCSGWDWHQSEGMVKLTTSLNAFFRREECQAARNITLCRISICSRWSGYPPKLSVTADVPARQPSATSGLMHRSNLRPYSITSSMRTSEGGTSGK